MGRSLERIAVGVLVFAVSLLTIVGLLAIWNYVGADILWKSCSTIGVIGVTALIVVGISRVANNFYRGQPQVGVSEPAAWKSARNILLGIIAIVFLFFAAVSILSIWDFIGSDTLWKAFQSMGLLLLSAAILLVAFKSQMEI